MMSIPKQTSDTLSLTGKRWVLSEVQEPQVEEFSRQTALHPLVSRILVSRGMLDQDDAISFLKAPTESDFHNPFKLHGMSRAVERSVDAIENNERILIHGDYDVDGIVASVLLKRTFDILGHTDTDFILPHRLRDGYGLSRGAIDKARRSGSKLLITVDCGITENEAVTHLQQQGVDVIILDHHLPGDLLPEAVAVIDPKQEDCRYPYRDLCGAGLALKFAQALFERRGKSFHLDAFCAMAAIGTVADVVPLTGENRQLVRLGLDYMSRPVNPGIRELLHICRIPPGRSPTSTEIGFRLAPRINAAGRIDSAEPAAKLFLTRNRDEAQALVRRLDLLNCRRQHIEEKLVEKLVGHVEAHSEDDTNTVLVLHGDGWHRGVIGIAASRLVDRFCRPVILLSFDGDLGHGSCRSISGFNITEALASSSVGLLERFGGHPMAAGLTIRRSSLSEFKRRLAEYCNEHLDPELLVPVLRTDCAVDFDDLSPSGVESLSQLEPHGMGNPKPVMYAQSLDLEAPPRLLKEKHLKFILRQDQISLEAVWWRAGHLLPHFEGNHHGLEAIFKPELNTWRNRTKLQLNIVDLRLASHSP